MNPRTNKQISVSFSSRSNEEALLKALNLICKEQSISRSAWIKQKIRDEIKFNNIKDLKKQLQKDKIESIKLLSNEKIRN